MAKLFKIAAARDVPPGQAAAFTVEGQRIALFNVEGTYYAIGDSCPHRGGPLAKPSPNIGVEPIGQARAPYRNNFILNWPSGPHAWPHPARTGPSNEANFFPVFVRGQTGNLEELQWMKV